MLTCSIKSAVNEQQHVKSYNEIVNGYQLLQHRNT